MSPIKWLVLSFDCFSVGLPELILSIDGRYLCSICRNHLSDTCFKGFSWSILYFLTLLIVFSCILNIVKCFFISPFFFLASCIA